VDASTQVGLGHLRRTLALAKTLQNRSHRCAFLIDDGKENLVLPLPFPRIFTLKNKRWDCAVVDSYTIRTPERRMIADHADVSICVVDGRAPSAGCDVLIDHNLYASRNLYLRGVGNKERTIILAGPQFAMMGEEIVRARGKSFPIRPKIESILVTLGGCDYQKPMRRLLTMLAGIARGTRVHILIPANEAPQLELPEGIVCHLHRGISNIGNIMRRTDLAISASGVTSLELACIGVPTICVILAENQAPGAQALETRKMAFNFGWPRCWKTNRFVSLYHRMENPDLRSSLSKNARKIVDGRGSQRIAQEIEKEVL
jgi:UDP-2,4-diacetamido-2,4,6-trideoxy-beta-L-altropyranose hydrolase